MPTGVKPNRKPSRAFERTLLRFRAKRAFPIQGLRDYLMESLEAFEVGNVLGAVQPLMAVLDHLEQMQRDKEIKMAPPERSGWGVP